MRLGALVGQLQTHCQGEDVAIVTVDRDMANPKPQTTNLKPQTPHSNPQACSHIPTHTKTKLNPAPKPCRRAPSRPSVPRSKSSRHPSPAGSPRSAP